jgi:predicted enzyme related to lactoylglutathione lyase
MPTIVHFDVTAENPERAKRFYQEIFDWKIERPPGPMDYHLIATTDLDGESSVGGGLGKREGTEPGIVVYIGVKSLDEYVSKVDKLGGKIIQPKTAVPGWGYLAVCLDTENNAFGLWEDDTGAK